MLTYNSKFTDELKKGKSEPATLVYLQDNIFFDEKTSQADWILNTSESNVDYTPSPPAIGDVELLLPDTWDSGLTDASTGRAYHAAIEYNGKMYVFGGYTTGYTNHVRIYDIAGDSWSNGTSGGTARTYHSAVEYNGKVYIFGGYTGAVTLNDVQIYDIAGDSWSSGVSGATIRQQHIAVEYNGYMYIYGGQNAGSYINTLYRYDIAGNSWTQLANGPGGRTQSVAIAYNGKIYIHGGFDGVTGVLDEVWEYNISGNSYSQLASGGVARSGHTAIEYAGEMYIFGGNDVSTIITNPQKFDPVSNTWFLLTDGSTLRNGHSAIEYLGKMYIFGGWNISIFVKDIWSHDMGYASSGHITTDNFDLGATPTAPGEWKMGDAVRAGTSLIYEAWSNTIAEFDQWNEETTTGTKPAARWGHSAIVYSGKAYLFGGEDGISFYSDVWELNLSTFAWLLKPTTGGPPSARAGHIAIEDSGKMYVFGGENGSSFNNEVWELDLSTFIWTSKTSGGTSGSYQAGVVYSGKVYLHGGFNILIGVQIATNNTWEYNIAGDSWTSKANGPTRGYHSQALSGDKMYTFGGTASGVALKNTYEYDITGDSWIEKVSWPTTGLHTRGATALIYGGTIYIYGGFHPTTSNLASKEFWKYNVSGDSWTQAQDSIIERFLLPSVLNGTDMVTIGGGDSGNPYNDVYSADLTGIPTYLGVIEDGDPITDLKLYYRVKASFTSSPLRDKTPTLSSITADFAEYLRIDHSIGLTALTTTIDLFEESTISQMTVTLALTKVTSNWMATSKPRNKRVKIFIGFRAEGFTDDDFEKFYFGTVADANITTGDKVQIFVEGFAKDWKEDVPNVWEDSGDNVVWTNVHPIDVMLDIYRQYLPVRDSALLLSSFDDVKAQTPGWLVSRTITDDPVEGKKLLEELRKLMSCFFVPQPDGAVKIIRWDPSAVAVASFTDTQLMSKNYKGNYKKIINRIYTYFNWAGTGDDAGDFDNVFPDIRTDSKDDYGKFETETVKDRWTQSAQLSQVEDRSTKLLDRYENPPPLMPVVVDLKNLAIEEGDIVNMTTKRSPSIDMLGITVVRFEVVKKQINWQKKALSWDVLAVTG